MSEQKESAFKRQVGGAHYTKMKIQPVEYILANEIGFVEGSVIAYVSRWKDKGGVEDLKKSVHMLQMLIENEEIKILEQRGLNPKTSVTVHAGGGGKVDNPDAPTKGDNK